MPLNPQTNLVNLVNKNATGSRRLRLILTPILGLSYLFFATLFVILAFEVDVWIGLPQFPPSPLNHFLAIPLLLMGLSLVVWTQAIFFRVKGTPIPINPPPQLVTHGPYAYVRNPMLSGVFSLLFGLGFMFRSLSLIVIFTPLFILLNVLELKKIEEPELELRLGQDYRVYKERTPMFLPKGRRER